MYRETDLENIERVTGLSRKQIESALAELRTFGWIDVDASSGQIATTYPTGISPTKTAAEGYEKLKV